MSKELSIKCNCGYQHRIELDGTVGFPLACGACGKILFEKMPDEMDRKMLVLDNHTKKDTDKTPFSLVDFEFIAGVARYLAAGLKNGRKRDDWRRLEWTPEVRAQYLDALLRHTVEVFDPFAIVCNAMIIWYNDRKGPIANATNKD